MAEPDLADHAFCTGYVECLRRGLNEVLRDAHIAGSGEFRQNQKVRIGRTVVEPVNSQHIFAALQCMDMGHNIYRLGNSSLFVRTVGQSG